MSPRGMGRKSESPSLELEATPQMCHYCFDILVKELLVVGKKARNKPTLSHSTSSTLSEQSIAESLPDSSISCPLFITWEKRPHSKSDDFQLRGCIGTLSPHPLVPSIREYALTSALRDRRFDPIHAKELPYLRVGVSLLVKYEECLNCHDWVVGVHGIIIRFRDKNETQYSATYLPEVAHDQQWTQRQAVQSLVRKSGYRGAADDVLLRKIQCTRYQSSKHRVTYQDYVDLIGNDPLYGDRHSIASSAEAAAASRRPSPGTLPCTLI